MITKYTHSITMLLLIQVFKDNLGIFTHTLPIVNKMFPFEDESIMSSVVRVIVDSNKHTFTVQYSENLSDTSISSIEQIP